MSTENVHVEEPKRGFALIRESMESGTESLLFASRWLLAPIYIGLVGGLLLVVIKFFQSFIELVVTAFTSSNHEGTIGAESETVVLGVLGLLDLALLANLLLIVIFAGYENFVSKINAAEGSEDRPHWMGHVDFSGLKIKLIGSLVAISVIELLQDFVDAGTEEVGPNEYWRVTLHMTFVLSGVLFALMDFIADKRKILLDQHLETVSRARAAGVPSSDD